MSIAAGELNRRITIWAKTGAVDAANQPIEAWEPTPRFTLWARIMSATGMAAVRAAQEGVALSPTKYSFRIRYRPTGIDTGMQVRYGDGKYDIRDIRHDHAGHEHTDLVCEIGGNNG